MCNENETTTGLNLQLTAIDPAPTEAARSSMSISRGRRRSQVVLEQIHIPKEIEKITIADAISDAIKYLESNSGYKKQGIFRLNEDYDIVMKVKSKIEMGIESADLQKMFDNLNVSGVAELVKTLITIRRNEDIYKDIKPFLSVIPDLFDGTTMIYPKKVIANMIVSTFKRLSSCEYNLFLQIIEFLQLVLAHKESGMRLSNLSTAFASILFTYPSNLQELQRETKIIESILVCHKEFPNLFQSNDVSPIIDYSANRTTKIQKCSISKGDIVHLFYSTDSSAYLIFNGAVFVVPVQKLRQFSKICKEETKVELRTEKRKSTLRKRLSVKFIHDAVVSNSKLDASPTVRS